MDDQFNFSNNKKINSIIKDEEILFSCQITKKSLNSFFFNKIHEINLLITNKAVYNLKGTSIKRRINFENIIGITISTKSNEFIIHGINSEYDHLYISQDREKIIKILQNFYKTFTHKDLLFCKKDEENLDKFVIKEKERKKDPKLSKIKENEFSSICNYLENEDSLKVITPNSTEKTSELKNSISPSPPPPPPPPPPPSSFYILDEVPIIPSKPKPNKKILEIPSKVNVEICTEINDLSSISTVNQEYINPNDCPVDLKIYIFIKDEIIFDSFTVTIGNSIIAKSKINNNEKEEQKSIDIISYGNALISANKDPENNNRLIINIDQIPSMQKLIFTSKFSSIAQESNNYEFEIFRNFPIFKDKNKNKIIQNYNLIGKIIIKTNKKILNVKKEILLNNLKIIKEKYDYWRRIKCYLIEYRIKEIPEFSFDNLEYIPRSKIVINFDNNYNKKESSNNENNELIKKISSKYIINIILSYIKEKNNIFNLFKYSKLYQEKLELNYIDYQIKYLEKMEINPFEYLYIDLSQTNKNFDKNILKKDLKKKLLKNHIDFEEIKSFLIKFFKNYIQKYKNDQGLFIFDIYSPFFDLLVNSEFLENAFIVKFSVDLFEKYNLKKDYIKFFKDLNDKNSKFPSLLFEYKNSEDIVYLEELLFDLGKVRKLIVTQKKYGNIFNQNFLFENLFKLKNLEKSLINLELTIFKGKKNELEPKVFDNLNNFILLEELNLKEFKFKSTFFLNLPNLKRLELQKCENISFVKDAFSNLNKLIILECKIPIPNNLIKFPKLETCILQDKEQRNKQIFNSIFDFSSLKNLKILEAEICDFLHINNSDYLEKVTLFSNNICKEEEGYIIERKMIEKLISIKSLKYINFPLNEIKLEEIEKVNDENFFVKDMTINFREKFNGDLSIIQNKFPYIKNLIFEFKNNLKEWFEFKTLKELKLNVNENPNDKIKEFSLINGEGNINFNLSYEDLEKIYFKTNTQNYVFPFLKKECNINFISLTELNLFFFFPIDRDVYENIYNNLDKMPKLKKFYLKGSFSVYFAYGDSFDFGRMVPFHKPFICKLLKLNLDYIYLNLGGEFKQYTEEELMELYPNFNPNNVTIYKITSK